MLRYILTMLIVFFASTSLFAQIATGSFFRETKSINPAIITQRPSAVFSIVGKADKVDKTQDLSSSSLGEGANSKTKVKINSNDLFYGGKGDGTITSELFFNYSQGKKENTISVPSQSTSTSDNVKSSNAYLGYGIGKNLGISMGYVKYLSESVYNFNFSGQTYNNNVKSDSLALLPKIGLAYRMGVDLGFYFQRLMITLNSNQNGTSTKDKQNLNIAGAGFGLKGKSAHFEAAYERQITPNKVTSDGINYKKVFPSRAMFTLEFILGKLALGYTGFYYQNGFINFDNLLFNSLVYSEVWDEPRLENNFNFSIGSDKGHSFSGSLSFSNTKTKEKDIFLDGTTKTKYDTQTKTMGISLKYSYAF